LVGKAFQVAFAESKFPKGTELKLEQFKTEASDKQIVQGRRWVCIKWLKNGMSQTLKSLNYIFKRKINPRT